MTERARTDLLMPFVPTTARPFDLKLAGHLARRVGFGASLAVRREWVELGVDRALDRAVVDPRGEDVDAAYEMVVALDDFVRLQSYRVWRLMAGRERLRERMSSFWHGHFATSFAKVQDVAAMARQFALFDAKGLGRFDELARGICRDPAMLRWLDNDTNGKGRPNENFARELFELFTLGRGAYTEADVREAARAFTGWHVRAGAFWFAAASHDAGEKSLFGQLGAFSGDEVLDLALARPESARFLAHELLVCFVHPDPTATEVDALAAEYVANDRDVGRTIRTLLRSELFFSPRAYRSRIKDPFDLMVGSVRSLGARASPARLAELASSMGLRIGEPPNVAGWPGGRAWLNPATWLQRANFAAELARADSALGLAPALDDAELALTEWVDILLDGELSGASWHALTEFERGLGTSRGRERNARLAHAIHVLPEMQLA